MAKRAVPVRTAPHAAPRRGLGPGGVGRCGGGVVLLAQGCGGPVRDAEAGPRTPAVAESPETASTSASGPSASPTPSPTPSATATSTSSATDTPTPTASPSARRAAVPQRKPSPVVPRTVSPPKAKTGAPLSFSAPTIDVEGQMRRISAVNGVVNPPSGALTWISGYGRVKPGQVGTAVIAGHVVSGRRADVFHDLQEIRRGDKVTVFDANGRRVVYTVTATRVATKKAVSVDQAVWGANRSVKRIALITCDDDDGYRADGHRVSNFVAIAEVR